MLEDAELLRRYARDKSEAAFSELVARYVDLVYSAALRQVGGDAHRAHDVSQVVFTTLARKAASLTSHPVLAGWLYTATQHAAAKAVRAEVRRRAREEEAHLMQETHAFGEAEADWARVRPVLDEAMRELHDRDREAVLLRFFAQRPFVEIARRCALTEDAARMRVERALDKLHALLARRGITSTSAALGLALANHAVAAAPMSTAAKLATSALGAASAGSSAAAGGALIEFMTAKLNFGMIGAMVLLATLSLSTYEWRNRLVAESELDRAVQEHARHTTRMRDSERIALKAEQEVAELQKTLSDTRARAVEGEAAKAKAEAKASWDPDQEGAAFVDRHLEVKKALYDYGVAKERFRSAPMYRSLNLSPEQIKRWETVNVAGTMGYSLTSGDGISMPIGEPMAKRDNSQYGKQLEEILGKEGMREWAKFSAIASARDIASDVASSLYFTDSPLSGEQADRLVELLAVTRNSGAAAKASAYNWPSLIAKAAEVMTPPQLAVLEGKRATDLFNKALNRPRTPPAAPGNSPATTGKLSP